MAPRAERISPRAWAVLFGCLVCQMGLGLGGYVFAVFLKPIVAELGWSRAAYSVSTLPMLLAMALASPLVGRLTDRAGARVVFAGGITLVAGTLWGFAGMQSLWHFYGLGALLGIGITGLGDIPAGAVVTRWFRHSRGLALGAVYVGSNLGGALVPVLATSIAAESSWRHALHVLAVGGWLVVLPAAIWLVRDRPPAAPGDDADAEEASDGLALGAAVRTRSFWILLAALFTFYFYYLGVNNHLVAYLSDAGLSEAGAARRFGYAVFIGAAGKLGVGLLADRIAVRRALWGTFAAMTAGSLLLLRLADAPALLPVFLTVHGVTVAAENVMLPLVVAYCFGPRAVASIYGVLMLALLPGGVLGPWVAGRVFDTTDSYAPAFTLFAVTNLLTLGLLLGVRRETGR
jgi:sugar phosphate permease